jgi:NitT/TauT family transport system permease protein
VKTTTFLDKTAHRERNSPPISQASISARRFQRRQQLFVLGGRVALCTGLLVIWQLVSGTMINPLFISSPLAVAQQLISWNSDGSLWYHTSITLQETLYGLFYGLISGIVAGFIFGIQPLLSKILNPFIIAIYSIPKVALAPLFILWFGIGIEMKVILAAVTVFFLVFLNTLAGVRNVDQALIDAVLLMGGKPRDIMVKVVMPSATGHILTGLRIAIPYALIGAVVAELIASNHGIGYLLNDSASELNTSGVFAALLVLTVIASLLNAIVNLIDRSTSRWKVTMGVGRKVIPQ